MRRFVILLTVLAIAGGCRRNDDGGPTYTYAQRVENTRRALQEGIDERKRSIIRYPEEAYLHEPFIGPRQRALELLDSGVSFKTPFLTRAFIMRACGREPGDTCSMFCSIEYLVERHNVIGVVLKDQEGNREEFAVFAGIGPIDNTQNFYYAPICSVSTHNASEPLDSSAEEGGPFIHISREALKGRLQLALLLEDGTTSNFVDVFLFQSVLEAIDADEPLIDARICPNSPGQFDNPLPVRNVL